ncbi:hypothetical protein EIN_022580, partial [Entamoeba invadens IP1]|uniref:hypothetical protein n=1 Tax=Entamoeba invadens IP1 TaxID=370355 RepID=UPI0002C3F178
MSTPIDTYTSLPEILPPSFSSYEVYCDELNDFLSANQNLFTTNHYDEDGMYLDTERSVHAFMYNQFDSLPEEWKSQFLIPLEVYATAHPEHALEVYCYLMDLMTDKMPTLPYPSGVDLEVIKMLKEKFPVAHGLNDFIDHCRRLTPRKFEDSFQFDPKAKTWFTKDIKGKSQPIDVVFMKQKKKYEIRLLGDLIIKIAKNSDVKTIVDVGSGKGYLTEYIVLNSPLRAVGIEGNADFTNKMAIRVNDVDRKRAKGVQLTHSESYTAFLTAETTSSEFCDIAKLHEESVLLTGLHPCGDLTPTLLRMFQGIPEIKSVCMVGCCYHKLTENKYILMDDEKQRTLFEKCPTCVPKKFGFPMSKRLLHDRIIKFHMAENYVTSNPHPEGKTREEWLYAMKMQSYRAALELFIHQHLPKFYESHYTGQIRELHTKTFGLYLTRALVNIRRHTETFEYGNKEYGP